MKDNRESFWSIFWCGLVLFVAITTFLENYHMFQK